MAREDIGRNAQQAQKLNEAAGSSPTSSPAHQGAPAPVADSSVYGQGKPGPDSGELWTHHAAHPVDHVGDLKILGSWLCGEIKVLPSSSHKDALDAGLDFKGPAAPDPAQLKAQAQAAEAADLARRGPVVGHGFEAELWTHRLDAPVTAVGDLRFAVKVDNGAREVIQPWCAGERRVLPTALHDKATAMGLQYLGPAR